MKRERERESVVVYCDLIRDRDIKTEKSRVRQKKTNRKIMIDKQRQRRKETD